MAWIKRNLFFVIGSVVALILMGLAGYYLFSKYTENNAAFDKLNAEYTTLDGLNKANPHPGNKKVDNIKAAKDQQAQLNDFMQKVRPNFQKIARIPDMPKVTDQAFSAGLSRTVDQLNHDASTASVVVPTNFNFSFEAERRMMSFDAKSLEPLSVQLGEVKTICDILFKARINYLDNIRRERATVADQTGPATDYVEQRSTTNELAVTSFYEVKFRCFTPELGAILAGFATSPYGMIIRTINVEVAPAVAPEPTAVAAAPVYTAPVVTPAPTVPNAAAEQDMFARRYGLGNKMAPPVAQPQQYAQATYPVATQPAASRGGPPTVLDEKLLLVNLNIGIVKLASSPTAK
jgi:hypothetical protein